MSSQLQQLKRKLSGEIELLQKELEKVETENAVKQKNFFSEQNLLMEARKENGLQQHKLRLLKGSLALNENALSESKAEFDRKQEQLVLFVHNFRKVSSLRNEKFKMSLQILRRVSIKNEDRYGNMEEYKRMMRKQIDEFKSEIALGHQEIESKRNEMAKLKKDFCDSVDQPLVGPGLKREISGACFEALKCQRKRLVDLKMLNHNMKFRCDMGQKP